MEGCYEYDDSDRLREDYEARKDHECDWVPDTDTTELDREFSGLDWYMCAVPDCQAQARADDRRFHPHDGAYGMLCIGFNQDGDAIYRCNVCGIEMCDSDPIDNMVDFEWEGSE